MSFDHLLKNSFESLWFCVTVLLMSTRPTAATSTTTSIVTVTVLNIGLQGSTNGSTLLNVPKAINQY